MVRLTDDDLGRRRRTWILDDVVVLVLNLPRTVFEVGHGEVVLLVAPINGTSIP